MAKATLKLPDGTLVSINGSAEEIAQIMSLHASATGNVSKSSLVAKSKKGKPKNRKSVAAGPLQRIRELGEEGFFNEKRSIVDIQKKLEENGHIYAQSSLSPALIRLVRGKTLRRIPEDKTWKYINP